jgi:hypothetical protein
MLISATAVLLLSTTKMGSAAKRSHLCFMNGVRSNNRSHLIRFASTAIFSHQSPPLSLSVQHEELLDAPMPPFKPFFPIFYNDVYEVDLPPGHRFPMEKYRKVRMALQDKILGIEEGNRRVDCGEILSFVRFCPSAVDVMHRG